MAATVARADDPPRLAEYFGFLPLEIYKLDPRINNVSVRDLDGDKVADVVVANNGRSRIDLLLSGKAGADESQSAKGETNHVPSDRRMRLRSLPVNKELVSVQVGDFNGDGKADLAYYGTPAELTVLYNQGNARFGNARRFSVGPAIEGPGALTVGDLNHDGRDDLALVSEDEVVLIYQGKDGKLGEPERQPHTAGKPWAVKAVDLDGDGGDDLVIVENGEAPIRVRFSTEGGRLGPEQRFTIETPRAYAFGDLDGKKGQELLTIEMQSGRVRAFTLDEGGSDEEERRGRLIFYPLPHGTNRGRSLALGDLDGDGKADVVVSDPANAQTIVYMQGHSKGAGLGTGQNFPGLVGGRSIKAADLDGDGKAEVLVLSEQEKQVGHSTFADGRLSFPEPLPISGEPVALEVADLNGDKTPEVLYVVRDRAKKEGESERFALKALTRDKAGTMVPFRWGDDDDVEIRNLNGAPPAIMALDANRDGLTDVLVFNSYGSPVLLLGRPGGEPPAPAGGGLGPLVGATPAGVTRAELDGPALFVAQNTYARNIALEKNGQWQVKDQYNAGRNSAQILGAAALDMDGDGTKEIVLLDRNSKSLLYLDRKNGVYRPSGTLAIGPIEFQGMHVADLDGDGRDDLMLAGTDRFGVVLTGRSGQRLKALASYETSREEARLGDLVAGDLNHDGRMDIALSDVAEHSIEIVSYAPDRAELDRGLTFKIFEQKSFRDFRDTIEPRDMAVGDVDGDGRADLVLIVHDRVLIYRQDPGPDDKDKDDKKDKDGKGIAKSS
jgi:hypothetical protein